MPRGNGEICLSHCYLLSAKRRAWCSVNICWWSRCWKPRRKTTAQRWQEDTGQWSRRGFSQVPPGLRKPRLSVAVSHCEAREPEDAAPACPAPALTGLHGGRSPRATHHEGPDHNVGHLGQLIVQQCGGGVVRHLGTGTETAVRGHSGPARGNGTDARLPDDRQVCL